MPLQGLTSGGKVTSRNELSPTFCKSADSKGNSFRNLILSLDIDATYYQVADPPWKLFIATSHRKKHWRFRTALRIIWILLPFRGEDVAKLTIGDLVCYHHRRIFGHRQLLHCLGKDLKQRLTEDLHN
ncbi:hypothetical protein AVEN_112778-1 [Araneus ventricosus]|uniref:Uncharacterized protein n=1 Tax=Araneus ventricosus TaxID=182803 RepID=A0A4Y2MNJ2_ARAVE|nr:hypothetical protein AVEN_111348-1 [Araneus ventricosus]GBN27394.1 hypothetical protein AVEN_112778-1 [Araneus ventricosus]